MSRKESSMEEIVWLNGEFLPLRCAFISPYDRGFLYGDGVFETMRAERGTVLCLHEHLSRLERSLMELRIAADLPDKWEALIERILEKNRLAKTVAVVKIIVTRGVIAGPGLPPSSRPTVCITAHKYIQPSPLSYERGWHLFVHKEGFSPPLAEHKSLNYLYFLRARQAAIERGADEAVVLDPGGYVSEASAGSLLARTDGKWWRPLSPYQLPGVTVGLAVKLLAGLGEEVEVRRTRVEDLTKAQTVWVLNSLILVMPVSAIDGLSVPEPCPDEASKLRELLIDAGSNCSSSHVNSF